MRFLCAFQYPLLFLSVSCAQQGTFQGPFSSGDPTPLAREYDVLDYELLLKPNMESGILQGITRISFRAEANTNEFLFDAVGMSIEGIELKLPSGEESSIRTIYDGEELLVITEEALGEGTEALLTIYYKTRPRAGFYFETHDTQGYPFPSHVFTQGECRDARYWFPCKDSPADRASHTLMAIVPELWETTAAGTMVDSKRMGKGMKTVTWTLPAEQEMPPYLFSFAAGEFVQLTDTWGGVDLRYLVEAGDETAARATFSRTGDILQFFSDYTGFPYPFKKYSHSVVRDFPYGAMENVSATTCGRGILRKDQELNPTWGTVAHEAAHQWFGNIVTCQSWPEAWLNEGFATYFNLLYRRETLGKEDFQWHMGATIDGYTNACRGEKKRPLVKYLFNEPMDLFFDGTIYPGGASRLQLLRGWVGEPTFKRAIQRYLQDNQFQSVTSESLKAALVSEGAEDMKIFFDDWVYSSGYPELDLSWAVVGNQIQVTVRQTHLATPHSQRGGTPRFFHFPLDLTWVSSTGERYSHRLNIKKREATFKINPHCDEVSLLCFDPDVLLPARIQIQESLDFTIARAMGSPSVRDRSLALRKLQEKLPTHKSNYVFQGIVSDETANPNLRAQALSGLSLPELWAALPSGPFPRNPKLSRPLALAWTRRLLQFAEEDHRVQRLEQKILDDDSLHFEFHISAIQSRAKRIQGEELRKFLLNWEKTTSEGFAIQRTSIRLIGNRLQGHKSLGFLLSRARFGMPNPIRGEALQALEPWLNDKENRDQVTPVVRDLLQSPSVPLRRIAAGIAARHPSLFSESIQAQLEIEPDARILQILRS